MMKKSTQLYFLNSLKHLGSALIWAEENTHLVFPQRPKLCDKVDQGQGHCERAEEDVGDSQVGDKYISSRQHHLK